MAKQGIHSQVSDILLENIAFLSPEAAGEAEKLIKAFQDENITKSELREELLCLAARFAKLIDAIFERVAGQAT